MMAAFDPCPFPVSSVCGLYIQAGLEREARVRHLFLCETPRSLFNMLLVRIARSGEPADALLVGGAETFERAERLRRSGLFDGVWQAAPGDASLGGGKAPGRIVDPADAIALSPELLAREYSDLWVGSEGLRPRAVYYCLLREQVGAPAVHLVEDGLGSCSRTVKVLAEDPFDEGSRGDGAFACHVADVWVYAPGLYASEDGSLEAEELPRAVLTGEEFASAMDAVFPVEPLPEERCIFFEQSFIASGGVADDFELVSHIASRFEGGVNVRLHPATSFDRFSPFDILTSGRSGCPWEVTVLRNADALSDKVFATVDSSAALAYGELFRGRSPVVLLDRVVWGSYAGKGSGAKSRCFEALERSWNEQGMVLYRPACLEELDIVLDCLSGRL